GGGFISRQGRKAMNVSRWLAKTVVVAAITVLVASASADGIQIQVQNAGQAQPGQGVPVQVRPGAPVPGGGPNVAPAWVPLQQVGGQVIPPAAQQKLKLTDEQKKKIDELQKEVEAKILGVLTEEQKKQYEQLKKPTAVQPNPGIRIQPNN